ncbi:MAG: TauD/TfdA dioxygenase family protein [Pseudohongiellaceae bacterium]
MLTVNAIDAPCGAMITGIDLAAALQPAQVSEIRAAWLQYHVLVFPDQKLQNSDLERFVLAFGNFGEDPFFDPIEGEKRIAAIRRDADEQTPLFAENWHTDWSFQKKPPIGTCLYGVKIPPKGGDTLFANQQLAYAKMPAEFRQRVQNLTAVHSAASAYSPDGLYSDKLERNSGRSMDIVVSEEALRTQTHPLVRPHTETGRPALYSTAGYIQGFLELNDKESQALLTELYEYQGSPEFVYRHHWQPNMLVLWDNRSVLHKATGGYDGHDRLLHRLTISQFD